MSSGDTTKFDWNSRTHRIATLGQLSASIAHELNQPLTGIIDELWHLPANADKRSPRTSTGLGKPCGARCETAIVPPT